MSCRHLVVLALVGGMPWASAAAQELGLAVGYTSMPGRIGDARSDHGVVARVGVSIGAGRFLRLGLEGAAEQLNRATSSALTTCVLPGGGTGPCTVEEEDRDLGLSLSGVVRVQPPGRAVRPYALLGVGLLSVRTRIRQETRDAAGNLLSNLSIEGTFTDGALQGHGGVGAEFRPAGTRVGFTVEGRLTWLVHNYSGGLQANWNPSLAAGVRFRL